MVGEFPELQGLMGRYYAEAEHMNPAIARAIELHYKPKGPTDVVPWRTGSLWLWRWPTSSTCWSASGPSARSRPVPEIRITLRRAALGVIRLVIDNDLRMPLLKLLRRKQSGSRLRAVSKRIMKSFAPSTNALADIEVEMVREGFSKE